jgi:hypothetical protein
MAMIFDMIVVISHIISTTGTAVMIEYVYILSKHKLELTLMPHRAQVRQAALLPFGSGLACLNIR